jgi:WD40 repeat protein
MSRSFSISMDSLSPASLDLSREADKVVVAGRNIFKIYSIDDEQNAFSERVNLRTAAAGKSLNLNYSCCDVAWSPHDDNVVASAATNGAVCVWNLGKTARSKLDHVFNDHKRTVQRVKIRV